MLDNDYPTQFIKLIDSTPCNVELPADWSDYFEQRGEVPAYVDDQRTHIRLKVRTHGLLWFERSLPFCDRTNDAVAIYTRDFSRHGSGFLVPYEIYPEEEVRIALPTFWVQLRVTRTRRITSKCYEIGSTLMERHDPGPEAFALQTLCAD